MDSEQVQEYLFNQFQYKLFSKRDIDISQIQMDNKHLNTVLNRLVKQKILLSFDIPGIYQFTKWGQVFGNNVIINKAGRDELLSFMYIGNNSGYYYGNSLLEYLGISTQIPRVLFIGSNNVTRKLEKTIDQLPVTITPTYCSITSSNKRLLQVLDTLAMPGMTSVEGYSENEVVEKMAKYVLSTNISNNEARQAFLSYPGTKLKKFVRLGIYDKIIFKDNRVPILN